MDATEEALPTILPEEETAEIEESKVAQQSV